MGPSTKMITKEESSTLPAKTSLISGYTNGGLDTVIPRGIVTNPHSTFFKIKRLFIGTAVEWRLIGRLFFAVTIVSES